MLGVGLEQCSARGELAQREHAPRVLRGNRPQRLKLKAGESHPAAGGGCEDANEMPVGKMAPCMETAVRPICREPRRPSPKALPCPTAPFSDDNHRSTSSSSIWLNRRLASAIWTRSEMLVWSCQRRKSENDPINHPRNLASGNPLT